MDLQLFSFAPFITAVKRSVSKALEAHSQEELSSMAYQIQGGFFNHIMTKLKLVINSIYFFQFSWSSSLDLQDSFWVIKVHSLYYVRTEGTIAHGLALLDNSKEGISELFLLVSKFFKLYIIKLTA